MDELKEVIIYTIWVTKNLIISIPSDRYSMICKISCSFLIVFFSTFMNLSINFHRQEEFWTIKIQNKGANGFLSSKLIASRSMSKKFLPHFILSWRWLISHPPSIQHIASIIGFISQYKFSHTINKKDKLSSPPWQGRGWGWVWARPVN